MVLCAKQFTMANNSSTSFLKGMIFFFGILFIVEFFVAPRVFRFSLLGCPVVYRTHSIEFGSKETKETPVTKEERGKGSLRPSPDSDPISSPGKANAQFKGKTEDEVLGWILSLNGWKSIVSQKEQIINDPNEPSSAQQEAQEVLEITQKQIVQLERFSVWLEENDSEAHHVFLKLAAQKSMTGISSTEEQNIRSAIRTYQQ